MLLNGGKTEHVNQLFSNRDDKGEFQMLFQELWDQPEKFFDYFRMRPAIIGQDLLLQNCLLGNKNSHNLCSSMLWSQVK